MQLIIPERLKKILLAIILHPVALALPVAVFFILVLPAVFDKYTVESAYEKIIADGYNVEYYDLDHDGVSEWYAAGDNGIGGSCVTLHNQMGVMYNWNFEGRFFPNQSKCIVGDSDNDGKDEIYAFTLKGDSLLINGIDFRKKGRFTVSNRLITIIPRYNGNINFHCQPLKITDLTGDGNKEVVFRISNGYGLVPRRVFALNVKQDSVFSSPELGVHTSPFDIADIDNDGKDEIALTNYGPGNMNENNLPMQDTCAYVMVLDNNLQFLFPPIELRGRYNCINNWFLHSNGKYFVVSFWDYNSQTPGEPALKVYDLKGNLMRERKLPFKYRAKKYKMLVIHSRKGDDKIILAPEFERFEVFDAQLNLVKKIPTKNGDLICEQYDFDLDGEKEMFFRSVKPGEWIILRNNLKNSVVFKTHFSSNQPFIYTLKNKNQKPQFCVQIDNHQYILEYGFNRMYYWQYPIYVGIYLLVLGFILLIQWILRVQIRKKYEIEKNVAELKYVSLHNQIAPHFTFNVLNTIGSAIMQEKKEDANLLLLKFSKLLRAILTNPDTVTRSLKEELDFVTNFLDIQQRRFKDLFSYHLEIDPQVNTEQLLPKSCIQTYVENALKHGITPLRQGGEIKIAVSKKENCLEISITDNGIGRKQAAINGSTSTGQGLKIMRQYYELLNKANDEPITETITDPVASDGKPVGTGVTIRIPDDFRFLFTNLLNR